MASEVKNNPDAIFSAQYAYTYGTSQTGRSQRQLVYEGFTTDEQGRQAIDALFINTGGSSLGSFNERFAVPWELGAFYHTKFPIRYEMRNDPVTGKRDGLGARVPAGLEPKIFHADTGSEQWGQGRVATLLHTTIDGIEDLSDPPNVRIYYMSGTKHGPGSWPPPKSAGQQELVNPLDYRYTSRALLAALDPSRATGQPASEVVGRHHGGSNLIRISPACSGRCTNPALIALTPSALLPCCPSWSLRWTVTATRSEAFACRSRRCRSGPTEAGLSGARAPARVPRY